MNRLEYLRIRAGMTQKELSERSGVDKSSISRVEKGIKDLPGAKWVSLAKALGCTTDELLGNSVHL